MKVKSFNNIRVNHFFFIIFNISILILLALFAIYTWNNELYIKNWSVTIATIAIIQFLMQLFFMIKKKTHYTDFRLWFIGLSYLFMFGRVFLNALGLDEDVYWNLISRYSEMDLYHSGLYIICSLQGVFIGFFLKDKNLTHTVVKPINKNNLKITGILLLLIGIPSRLIYDFDQIKQALSTGSYLELEHKFGLYDDLALLVIPGVFYLIASERFKKRTSFFIILITLIYFVFVMVMTGDRRYQFSAVIALVLFFLRFYNVKFNLKSVFSLTLISALFLNVLVTIRNIRKTELHSTPFFQQYWEQLISFNVIKETMSEFGVTFFSIASINKYVPIEIPFQYGKTFLISLLTFLPIGHWVGDLFYQATVSTTINIKEGAPVGSSLLGDIYINFGWLGIIVSILFGYLYSHLINSNKIKINNIYIVKYFSLFYVLLMLVRSNFTETVRSVFVVYVIPLIIIVLINNYVNKNKVGKKS